MAFPPSPGYRSFRDHLGPQNWRALLDIGTQARFEPGQTVLNQGEEGHHVLAVVRGVCKVVAARPDRGQVLLAVRGPGDTLGEFGKGKTVVLLKCVQDTSIEIVQWHTKRVLGHCFLVVKGGFSVRSADV